MMKRIEVLNRQILTFMDKNRDFYPRDKFALIRFFNPGSPYTLRFPRTCVDNLEIVCDDVSNYKMEKAHRYIFFDESMAVQILKFVEEVNEKIDLLVVACEAGISRSAGCAAALEKIYLGTDDIFMSTKYYPNHLIYRTLMYLHQKPNY